MRAPVDGFCFYLIKSLSLPVFLKANVAGISGMTPPAGLPTPHFEVPCLMFLLKFSIVFDKKLAIIRVVASLYVMCHFPLAALKISLCFLAV